MLPIEDKLNKLTQIGELHFPITTLGLLVLWVPGEPRPGSHLSLVEVCSDDPQPGSLSCCT